MKKAYQFLQLRNNYQGERFTKIFADDTRAMLGVLTVLVFIVSVISVSKYDLTAGVMFSAFPVFLIIALQLPLKPVFTRLLLLSPFILVMSIANFFYDHRPFLIIGNWKITAGVVSGIVILCKSIITVTMIIVFSYLLPFHRFCMVLGIFRVPDVFVTQLLLLYRYSFLLVEEAQSLQKARNMRSFGKRGRDIFTTAKMIGSLLLRTSNRAGSIYRAMVARGFDGHIGRKYHLCFRGTDILIILSIFSSFLAIRIIF